MDDFLQRDNGLATLLRDGVIRGRARYTRGGKCLNSLCIIRGRLALGSELGKATGISAAAMVGIQGTLITNYVGTLTKSWSINQSAT